MLMVKLIDKMLDILSSEVDFTMPKHISGSNFDFPSMKQWTIKGENVATNVQM